MYNLGQSTSMGTSVIERAKYGAHAALSFSAVANFHDMQHACLFIICAPTRKLHCSVMRYPKGTLRVHQLI